MCVLTVDIFSCFSHILYFVKLLEYKRNWIQHVNRMPRDRLPRIMKHYSPTGRKNRGRPLKRLLGTWDRNGSTSGLTPWQTYDDDDDDETVYSMLVYNISIKCVLSLMLLTSWLSNDYSSSLLFRQTAIAANSCYCRDTHISSGFSFFVFFVKWAG